MTGASSQSPRGVLYYAVGERFAREALVSAGSVKRHMPDLPIAIVTDQPVPGTLFDVRLAPEADIPVKRQKMRALQRSPFEQTLYLDTDTFVADALWELFDLLARYELAAALEPFSDVVNKLGPPSEADNEVHGLAARYGVQIAFPEVNSGVIAFKRSPAVTRLLAAWGQMYIDWDGKRWDQAPFRAALYQSDASWVALPPTYNYRIHFPNGINGVVKIFHGRHPYLAELCERFNQRNDRRLVCQYEFRKGTMYFTSFDVRPTLLGITLTCLKGLVPQGVKDRARAFVERRRRRPRRPVDPLRSRPGAPGLDAVKAEQAETL